MKTTLPRAVEWLVSWLTDFVRSYPNSEKNEYFPGPCGTDKEYRHIYIWKKQVVQLDLYTKALVLRLSEMNTIPENQVGIEEVLKAVLDRAKLWVGNLENNYRLLGDIPQTFNLIEDRLKNMKEMRCRRAVA